MNIVITGCSQGIGFEISKFLINSGKHKIAGISRIAGILKELEGGNSNTFKGILFDIGSIQKNPGHLLTEINKHFDHVDILINNAGFLIRKEFQSFTEEEISQIFNINFFAPVKLIELLLPVMGKKNRSHVVNIGSMGGFQGSTKYPGLAWYSASKAALANITESLATELSKNNVAINCLALGAVETQMLMKAFPGYKAPVKASEMAEFIADFALTGQKFFNGKILPVSLSNP
jgi:3-oxoacyl-[acyl-carrier protein] reductase